MDRTAADPAVERYLDRVRASLRGMPGPEIEDTLLELRGHLAEQSESGVDVATLLSSLGDPEELGRQYRAERVAVKAECGGSPIHVLHSLLLLRRGSFGGWVAFALAGFGYAWAFVIGAAAIEKILSPHDVGLWYGPGGGPFPRLTIEGPGPVGTRELLGWWIVPLGLAACAALIYLTGQFGLWRIRRARKSTGWMAS